MVALNKVKFIMYTGLGCDEFNELGMPNPNFHHPDRYIFSEPAFRNLIIFWRNTWYENWAKDPVWSRFVGLLDLAETCDLIFLTDLLGAEIVK